MSVNGPTTNTSIGLVRFSRANGARGVQRRWPNALIDLITKGESSILMLYKIKFRNFDVNRNDVKSKYIESIFDSS